LLQVLIHESERFVNNAGEDKSTVLGLVFAKGENTIKAKEGGKGKIMNRFKRKLMGPVVVLFALSWFYSNANGTEAENWELQMTGDTKGTLKMALGRVRSRKGYLFDSWQVFWKDSRS